MLLPDRAAQMALQPSSPSLFSRLASNHRMGMELDCPLMLIGAACADRCSAAMLGLSAMQKLVRTKSMLSCAMCCK